jgi:undecaprenyl-diphosphatase
VVEHRAGVLDPVMQGLSAAGNFALLWVGVGVLLSVLLGGRPLFVFLLTAATVWSADLVTLGLKALVGRDRPFVTVPEADPLVRSTIGQSFPSGHAATSFAGAVVLTYLFPRGWPAFFTLAAAVAFSRVYVGVHYPTDILAGAVVGTAVGLLAVSAVRRPPRSGPTLSRRERDPTAG